MKLQVALDICTIPEALELLRAIHDYVDIVEVGTPFLMNYGLAAVREIKQAYPEKDVLADLKIMDAGAYETAKAIEAGADIVTVLAVSSDLTIQACVQEANRHDKSVMVDMINVKLMEERAREVEALGVDYICVHTGTDLQSAGESPLRHLKQVKCVVADAKIAVAGGINLETLPAVLADMPDVIVVGGAITTSPNRAETASAMKRLLIGGASIP